MMGNWVRTYRSSENINIRARLNNLLLKRLFYLGSWSLYSQIFFCSDKNLNLDYKHDTISKNNSLMLTWVRKF